MIINVVKETRRAEETPEISKYEMVVDESYTVAYLKYELDIMQGRQFRTTVMYGDVELRDDDVLKDVGVTAGDTIVVKIKELSLDLGHRSAWTIVIERNGSRRIPGLFSSERQIGELKTSLAQQLDTKPEMIRFVHDGRERSDQEVIGDLGILEADLQNYHLYLSPRFENHKKVGYTFELKRNEGNY